MSEPVTPSRIKAIAWAGAALFMVAVAMVSAALVWNARTVALDDNEAQATRFVAGAEAALNRSLLSVDVLLASMDELLGLSGAMRDWIDPVQASQRLRSSARLWVERVGFPAVILGHPAERLEGEWLQTAHRQVGSRW